MLLLGPTEGKGGSIWEWGGLLAAFDLVISTNRILTKFCHSDESRSDDGGICCRLLKGLLAQGISVKPT
jgi:hypothetical protein